MSSNSVHLRLIPAKSPNISHWDDARAKAIIQRKLHLQGAMLPILHELQLAFGYIDARAVPDIANALNVSKAEVHGVISFYHDFCSAPAGRHVLKICRSEACQSMGVESLVAHLAHTHRLAPGETSANGGLTVENVYCLGNCALAPSAMMDGELLGRLDRDTLDTLVLDTAGGRS